VAKYAPLRQHLELAPDEPLTMTFEAIADLVGGLPVSAFLHRAWWANHRGRHVHAHAWLDAGRTVTAVDIAQRQVTFSRAARIRRNG
jgi:hypothetical protein